MTPQPDTDFQDDDFPPLTAEDQELLAMLEAGAGYSGGDTTLTPMQRAFQEESGAYLVPDANAPLSASTTISSQIDLVSVDDRGMSSHLGSIPLDGFDDPIVSRTLNRYAAAGTYTTPDARDTAFLAALTEAAKLKAASRRPQSTRSTPVADRVPIQNQAPASTPVQTPPTAAYTRVGVNLGFGGRLNLAFRNIIIHDQTLVLVADPSDPGGAVWIPPPPHPDGTPATVELDIEGLPTPVSAYSIGVTYPYQGLLHYVLLIDRPTE